MASVRHSAHPGLISFMGPGKRPSETPRYHVDLDTGISGGTGGDE